ncbi:MAG: hypothetical protein V1701_06810 [Planctomycetota bacterium]
MEMLKTNGAGKDKRKGNSFARTISAFLVIIGIMAFISACGSKEILKVENGRHQITLTELKFTEADFSRGVLGDKLDVEMTVYKDGALIFTQRMMGSRITGKPESPVVFEIDYSKDSRYLIKLKEVAIIADAKEWSLPVPPDATGYCSFNGKITFGEGSWVEFIDKKVK